MTGRRFLAHLLAGLGLRLALAWFWNGSYDVYTLVRFAGVFQRDGLWALYADGGRLYHFHPAVVVLYAAVLFLFSGLAGLPLHLAVKLPAVAGDLLSAGALRAARPTDGHPFLLFWWNPISLLTTCYHGNFDSLHTALVLCAALLLARETSGRSAGLAWAGAIVLKKVPMLWAPALLASARGRPSRSRLFLWGVLPAGAAFLLALVLAPEPRNVVRAFTYSAGGYEGSWGIVAVARMISPAPSVLQAYTAAAPAAILAASLLLVPLFRRLPPWRAVLLQVLTFYLLTTGFGLQYLAWVLPFLALAGARLAFPLCAAGTLHLSLAYVQGASKAFRHDLRFQGNIWNDVHAGFFARAASIATSEAWDELLLGTAVILWLVVLWTAITAARPDVGGMTSPGTASALPTPDRRDERGAVRRLEEVGDGLLLAQEPGDLRQELEVLDGRRSGRREGEYDPDRLRAGRVDPRAVHPESADDAAEARNSRVGKRHGAERRRPGALAVSDPLESSVRGLLGEALREEDGPEEPLDGVLGAQRREAGLDPSAGEDRGEPRLDGRLAPGHAASSTPRMIVPRRGRGKGKVPSR